jgi:hypothetical protein
VQLADESLYFSSIDTNEIVEQVIESANIDVSTQITENEIKQDVEVVGKLTTHDLRLTTSKPKRELPKTSSIGSMFKEIHKEVAVVVDENKVELTAENVQEIWNNFLSEHKDKLQNAFLSAAQNQTPELIEDKVSFTASNNVSLEMLQLHKMDITAYFRKKTTSTTVVPDFILKRDDAHVKNYKTSKDRLKDMIDANSAVLKLIEKFDLNID